MVNLSEKDIDQIPHAEATRVLIHYIISMYKVVLQQMLM